MSNYFFTFPLHESFLNLRRNSKNIFRHHILQFGPVIQKGNEHLVHHMEVFHCAGPVDLEIPSFNGPCDSPDRPEKTQVKSEFQKNVNLFQNK